MTGQYTYLKQLKVRTQNLRIGMYVSGLDKSWAESSFTFQGFPINDDSELLALQNECDWVTVDFHNDAAYQNYLETVAPAENSAKKIKYLNTDLDALREELPRARKNYDASSRLVKNVMQNILRDEEFELAPIQQAVKDCVDSILHNPDALLLLTNIKNADEYTAEHCLRVAIMAIAFGKYLGMQEEELQCIGIGAMLHDVGKVRIPNNILNKPGKLSPAEYCVMKDHAIEGFNILKEKKQLSPGVIEIALSHHERLDGHGYPRKLINHQISRYTRIVSIIDTFDAITSERIYSPAESPSRAFKVILDNSAEQFDPELAKRFVEWMGVYPVGSIVEMRTGEIGIVTKMHPEQKLKPRVYLVTDEKKQSGYEKTVDLAKIAVHSNGNLYQIKTIHPNGSFGVNLNDYINNGLMLSR